MMFEFIFNFKLISVQSLKKLLIKLKISVHVSQLNKRQLINQKFNEHLSPNHRIYLQFDKT